MYHAIEVWRMMIVHYNIHFLEHSSFCFHGWAGGAPQGTGGRYGKARFMTMLGLFLTVCQFLNFSNLTMIKGDILKKVKLKNVKQWKNKFSSKLPINNFICKVINELIPQVPWERGDSGLLLEGWKGFNRGIDMAETSRTLLSWDPHLFMLMPNVTK